MFLVGRLILGSNVLLTELSQSVCEEVKVFIGMTDRYKSSDSEIKSRNVHTLPFFIGERSSREDILRTNKDCIVELSPLITEDLIIESLFQRKI